MNLKLLGFGLSCLILFSLVDRSGEPQKTPTPAKPKLAISIKPQHVADALRAVILSDREIYTQVAAGLHGRLTRTSGTNGLAQADPALPSPCEMLRLGSQSVATKGVEYSYVLRSLEPLSKRNAPETEAETKGLQFVAARPDLIYTSEELLGGRWYFTAVYPDTAVNQSCVTCHNQQRGNSTKEFKLGDVMGALVVRIALEL